MVNTSETIMIGDRELEIQAGRLAGIRTCFFGQAILTIQPDLQVNNYDQFLKILQDGN